MAVKMNQLRFIPCLDLCCHLLLFVSQLHAGAFPRGEEFGSGDHLPIFKLQVLHHQLQKEYRVG